MSPQKQDTALGPTLLLALIVGLLAACQGADDPACRAAAPPDESSYRTEIEAQRLSRERAFRDPQHSPVPEDELADWSGLEFYPVDPAFRLEGRLQRLGRPKALLIPDTGGQDRRAEEVGYFLLDLGSGKERLPLFRMLEDGHWFLPFLDATSEVETYPAGRYLEVEELGDGRFRLDFNAAYNPYCAYGGDWSCPITPESNRLKAAVRAGERGYRYLEE